MQYSHCSSLVSMRSSSVSNTTTKITLATNKELKPALSKQTCHRAALLPQHGFNQLDLRGQDNYIKASKYYTCRICSGKKYLIRLLALYIILWLLSFSVLKQNNVTQIRMMLLKWCLIYECL